MEDPGQKAVVDMLAEGVAVDFDLGVQIQDVGNLDVFDPVQERLIPLDIVLVLGIHEGQEEGIDVLLQVVHLVDPFADDVVELDEPVGVVPLDVHEGIDAVVGLGILGEDVLHQVAVLEGAVDPVLEHVVGEDALAHGLVAGGEDADPFAQAPVEAIWAGV